MLSATRLELTPFTIPNYSAIDQIAQDTIWYYSLRWVTTIWLIVMIVKALLKRGDMDDINDPN